GQGVEDTRRVAARPELVDVDWLLVKSLADYRLVVTDKNENGEEIVEIVHEALIQNWIRLRDWVNKDREFRVWQDQLGVKQKQWRENEQHASELLGGRFLEQSKGWLHDRGRDLSEVSRDYIQASIAHQQHLEVEEKLQTQRDQQKNRWMRI